MKLITFMLVLFMTVYVVHSADAVIEDEDENTNPKSSTPTKATTTPNKGDKVSKETGNSFSEDDDYVPSEEEASEEESDENDDGPRTTISDAGVNIKDERNE